MTPRYQFSSQPLFRGRRSRRQSSRRQSASASSDRSTQRAAATPSSRPFQSESPNPSPKSSPKPSPQARKGSSKSRKSRSPALVNAVRFRFLVVWLVLMVGIVSLAFNLFRLQVLDANVLQERALQQQATHLQLFLPRRHIVDRDGSILALDQLRYTLYVHPLLFQEAPMAIAEQLAEILDQDPHAIRQEFDTAVTGVRIADGISETRANEIAALYLDGIELVPYQQRLYPQEGLFADVVGYVDLDRIGQAGLEHQYEDWLAKPATELDLVRTGEGDVLPMGLPESLVQPDDLRLQLTLDHRLQRLARAELTAQLDRFSALRGGVLVMDVKDGAVRCLVAEPSYDPNHYYKADVELFKNWLISDVYEPGSTFKPINVAIALEAGVLHPDDVFYDPGHIEIGGWPIENFDYEDYGGRGMVSVTDIIKDSSNVGMVQIMRQLEAEEYYNWLTRLGLGKITGIDLPFEAAGYLKSEDEFTGALIEPATTAFGQGFSLTPIQLLQLNAAIANGGKLVTPYIVEGLVNPEGDIEQIPDRSVPHQLFSQETTDAVLAMMETVVNEGTGRTAQMEGYRIAGKTGTSQKAGEHGTYEEGKKITSFVSIFPVNDPQYAVLVIVDEPQGIDAFGSTVAAPVSRSVMEAIAAFDQIPPSALPPLDE